jgi:hypothetical protein
MGDNEMILPTPGVSVESWLGRCNGCDEHLSQLRAADARQAVAVSRRAELEAERLEARLEVRYHSSTTRSRRSHRPSASSSMAHRRRERRSPTTPRHERPVWNRDAGDAGHHPRTATAPYDGRRSGSICAAGKGGGDEARAHRTPPQRQGEVAVKLEGEPLLLTADPELIASEVASIYELAGRPQLEAISDQLRASRPSRREDDRTLPITRQRVNPLEQVERLRSNAEAVADL